MIKIFLIAGGIILLGGFCLIMWAFCKAAGDADKEMGYNYITKEDWETM